MKSVAYNRDIYNPVWVEYYIFVFVQIIPQPLIRINYKHLVRFGYTYYGSYVSSSAIACESANLQNKFWEMHDSIMHLSYTPDTSDIFRIVQNLDLNLEKFKNDFSNPRIYKAIENNLYLLNAAGVYGTPTILINNKPLFNSSSFDDIINTLEEELTKSY